MNDIELAEQEIIAPALAVQALNSAHRRARASGRPMVLVVGGNLVRIGPLGTTVLKELPRRVKVAVLKKRATT